MVSACPSSFIPSSSTRDQFAITPLPILIALGESCSRAEILTFTALAAHVDHDGHCWPGRERLANLTGLNPSRVSKATTGLERKGFLRKEGAPGFRVDYWLLSPVPKPEPPPDRNGTTPLIETAHRTDQGTDQKPERAPTAEPAATPAQAPLSQDSLRNAKTPPPDCIPDGWMERAISFRPDLPADQIKTSIENFLDRNRAKGSQFVDWEAELRVWLRRERAPRPQQTASKATQPDSRYPSPDQPQQPVSAAVRAALEVGEQRRIAMMVRCGIDPTTGLKTAPPPPAATLPDGEPLPAGRTESPEQYTARFEQHREYQLRQLERLIREREGRG